MRNPDFLVVGAPKCATTWLSRNLNVNPQIFVPKVKDIYFFDQKYSSGFEYYSKFFAGTEDFKVCGEFSHNYMYSSTAMFRIKNDLPKVKIIITLRNPIERSISHAKFFVRDGLSCDIFDAAKNYWKFVVEWSMYQNYLPQILKEFHDRILLVFHEDISENPSNTIQKVCEFLDVDYDQNQSENHRKVVLGSSYPRNLLIARAAKRTANFLRQADMHNILARSKTSKVLNLLLYKSANEDPKNIKNFRCLIESELKEAVMYYDSLRSD